jgi:tetratricopeptide (TPR) repeat protein
VLGDLYEQMAKYDSAQYFYGLYAKEFPDDFRSYRDIGELYIKMADFSRANEYLDKAMILEPGNIGVMLLSADVSLREGNFEKAVNLYEKALITAKSPRDSASVFFKLDQFYAFKGQMKKSLEYYLKARDEFAKYNPPKNILVQSTFSIDKYVLAGRDEEAFKQLKKFESEFQPPLDKVIAFGYLFYYIELANADEAEKHIADAMEVITGFGEEMLMGNIYYARARIAEIRKDFKSALENYTQYAVMQPGVYPAYQWLARCHRELGDESKAQENIQLALRYHPFDPENNYEAALVYLTLGDKRKAKEHLDRALKVWASSDPEYQPYQKALLTFNEIE